MGSPWQVGGHTPGDALLFICLQTGGCLGGHFTGNDRGKESRFEDTGCLQLIAEAGEWYPLRLIRYARGASRRLRKQSIERWAVLVLISKRPASLEELR